MSDYDPPASVPRTDAQTFKTLPHQPYRIRSIDGKPLNYPSNCIDQSSDVFHKSFRCRAIDGQPIDYPSNCVDLDPPKQRTIKSRVKHTPRRGGFGRTYYVNSAGREVSPPARPALVDSKQPASDNQELATLVFDVTDGEDGLPVCRRVLDRSASPPTVKRSRQRRSQSPTRSQSPSQQ